MNVKSLSRVRLLATPWTAAHGILHPMGFSRQEYWSGVPLPSPAGILKYELRAYQDMSLVVLWGWAPSRRRVSPVSFEKKDTLP